MIIACPYCEAIHSVGFDLPRWVVVDRRADFSRRFKCRRWTLATDEQLDGFKHRGKPLIGARVAAAKPGARGTVRRASKVSGGDRGIARGASPAGVCGAIFRVVVRALRVRPSRAARER